MHDFEGSDTCNVEQFGQLVKCGAISPDGNSHKSYVASPQEIVSGMLSAASADEEEDTHEETPE